MEKEFIQHLFEQDHYLLAPFVAVLCAWALAYLAPLPKQLQPLLWFNRIALLFASKVNHPQRSTQQRYVAGILASSILIIPIIIFISAFQYLVAFEYLYEILIIYLCLQPQQHKKITQYMVQAQLQHAPDIAKTQLQTMVDYNCQQLSNIGLNKAIISWLLTSACYETVGLILAYFIGGLPLLLLAILSHRLNIAWSELNPHYHNFGQAIATLKQWLFWLPSRLWGLTLIMVNMGHNYRLLFKPLNDRPVSQTNNGYIERITAAILSIELGGPKQYQQHKVRLAKQTFGQPPTSGDVIKAIKYYLMGITIWLYALVLLPIIWIFIRYLQF